MIWQDVVIASGSWLSILFLLPTVLSDTRKPHWLTGISFFVILAVFAFTFVSLGLWLSSIPTLIQANIYGLLAYQSYKIKLKVI